MEKREIKFRAWDKNKMYEVTALYPWDIKEKNVTCRIKDDTKDRVLRGGSIMQYTGLKDKNGKEICEGDIIKTLENNTYEIKWNELHCGWALFDNCGMKDMMADWINDDGSCPKRWECKSLEVVGNIYENKDLIK